MRGDIDSPEHDEANHSNAESEDKVHGAFAEVIARLGEQYEADGADYVRGDRIQVRLDFGVTLKDEGQEKIFEG